MSFWIILLSIIAGSLVYRALLNYIRFKKVNSLRAIYETDHNKFIEESQIALSLFKEAGLKDSGVQVITKSGLVLSTPVQDIPQYQQQTISVFDNLTFNHKDVRPAVIGLFMKSKGVFRHRFKESINPLFWIQFTLTLPSYLLQYFGLKEKNIIMKLTQLVYWVIGITKILLDLKIINFPFHI